MYHFGNCVIENNNRIINCKESKRSFIVKNETEKKILKVQVDKPKDKNSRCNGLKIKGKKCDCLIIVKEDNFANFIELKGHHVDYAVKQLLNSIKVISDTKNKFIDKKFNKINAYIVSSKVPKDVNIIKHKKFFKKMEVILIIKNNKIKISI